MMRQGETDTLEEMSRGEIQFAILGKNIVILGKVERRNSEFVSQAVAC